MLFGFEPRVLDCRFPWQPRIGECPDLKSNPCLLKLTFVPFIAHTPRAALNYWIKIRLNQLILDYALSLQFSPLRRAVQASLWLTSGWHAIAGPQKLQIVQIYWSPSRRAAIIIRLGWDIFIALGRRRSVNIIKTPHCSIGRAESVGAQATFHLSRPTAAEADTKSGRRGRDLGPGTREPTCVQRPPGVSHTQIICCHRAVSLLHYDILQNNGTRVMSLEIDYTTRLAAYSTPHSTCTLLGACTY